MSDMQFKTCVDARRYMFEALATWALEERSDAMGRVIGPLTNDFDVRRMDKELKRFRNYCLKRVEQLR